MVLEVDPKFQYGPEALNGIYVRSSTGQQVPLSTLVDSVVKVAPLVVNHQGQFPSVTISFNLTPGTAIGQARLGDLNSNQDRRSQSPLFTVELSPTRSHPRYAGDRVNINSRTNPDGTPESCRPAYRPIQPAGGNRARVLTEAADGRFRSSGK